MLPMRILIVGGGGREHALAWKLSQEAEVIVAPGNPGISDVAETVDIGAADTEGLIALCRERSVDLVVVGPEDPLINGLGDRLRHAGVAVFGPNASAAQLEASKAFSKEVMLASNVPTSKFRAFQDSTLARDYARSRFDEGIAVAVKASGNALGKGVVVCDTVEEAFEAIRMMIDEESFGEAGKTLVIEDRLTGPEFSLLSIVGDENFVSLPVAQDHKRALDGDLGPNTGGMGTYSPVEWVTPAMVEEIERQSVAPIIAALKARGIGYRGTLFSGFMVQNGTPYCLEYNVRFGDPETQSVMLRLGNGLANALWQAATGQVIEAPEVLENASASVVVAIGGYPGRYSTGVPVSIGSLPEGARLFHSGTAIRNGQLVTAGGRVISASASAPTLDLALERAYQAAEAVQFEGAFYRRDIGAKR
jgi:phosphoribosylamine---glycine ligase